jgi:hypothetical protein
MLIICSVICLTGGERSRYIILKLIGYDGNKRSVWDFGAVISVQNQVSDVNQVEKESNDGTVRR